ncbi:MAG: hypothetical protein LBQ55_05215 [Treponema sp.]|nr:hypothetical protein [Treponema sp.]
MADDSKAMADDPKAMADAVKAMADTLFLGRRDPCFRERALFFWEYGVFF